MSDFNELYFIELYCHLRLLICVLTSFKNIIEMSDKVHYKGRFIIQKVLNKRLKAVAAMAEAKKRKKNCTKNIGNRIVEVDELHYIYL